MPKTRVKAKKKSSGERDRHCRRHHQAQLVVRVVVVDAVDDEVHAPAEGVVGLPVEDEAVQPVLGQRPDRDPAEAQPDQGERSVAAVRAQPLHRDDDGDEDDRRDRRVHPGEEVEEFALEQLGGVRELLGPAVGVHRQAHGSDGNHRLSRKTRGSCDETVSKMWRFAEMRLARGARRWQYRPPCRARKSNPAARTATSRRTCSARSSWRSPAPPSGRTGPRGSSLRGSPCC